MTAAILKGTPQPGDFICVPIAGQVGKLIEVGQFLAGQKFQPYEHAEVYIGQADANGPYGYTVSAYPDRQGKQALPCAPQDYAGSLWSSGLISLSAAQRASIVNYAVAHEHIGYSALDYFALAAHRLHIPSPGLKAFIGDTGHMICSQFTDYSYEQAGVHLFTDNRWPGYVMPMDLASLLESKMGTAG